MPNTPLPQGNAAPHCIWGGVWLWRVTLHSAYNGTRLENAARLEVVYILDYVIIQQLNNSTHLNITTVSQFPYCITHKASNSTRYTN